MNKAYKLFKNRKERILKISKSTDETPNSRSPKFSRLSIAKLIPSHTHHRMQEISNSSGYDKSCSPTADDIDIENSF